jgi:hypothetical protein
MFYMLSQKYFLKMYREQMVRDGIEPHDVNKKTTANKITKTNKMKKTTTKLTSLLLLLVSLTSYAQTYHGHYLRQVPSSSNVTFNACAYDKSGNLYAAGAFVDTARFDHGTVLVSAQGSHDIIIAKFDRNGHTLWAKAAGGVSDIEEAKDIAIDSNSNVYVTGSAQSGGTFGGITPSNGTYSFDRGFLAKLDAAGTVLWVKGGVAVSPKTLYVDKSNHVFVAGSHDFSTGDPPSFAGVAFYDPAVGSDVPFIWKMDGNGSVLNRAEPHGSGGNTFYDIDGDAQGNIVGVGTYGYYFEYDSGVVIQNPRGQVVNGTSSFVIKFDNKLHVQWARTNWSSGSDELKAVAVDSLGDVYAAGHYVDTAAIGSSQFFSPSYTNTLFVKYNAAGTQQWAKSYGNGESGKEEYHMVYDAEGKRLWAAIYGQGYNLGATPLVSGLAIAEINRATGAIGTVIQSTTDLNAYGKGIAVWHRNIGVAGGSSYGLDSVMTLLGKTIPGVYNGPTNGFVFEFTDTLLATGIEETPTLAVEFAVYPNPASTSLNIRYQSDDNTPITAVLVDIMGREVLSEKLVQNNTQINIGHVAPGMYHVVLMNENGRASKRIVIQ